MVIDRRLETKTVRRVIKEAAQRYGLRADQVASFSGHSMRVGAVQDLLKRVFDTAAIMRTGSWKSVNVRARYLEKAEHSVWVWPQAKDEQSDLEACRLDVLKKPAIGLINALLETDRGRPAHVLQPTDIHQLTHCTVRS